MNYLKADGYTVLKYPYTSADLQADNPNTGFPVPTPDEVLEDFGMFPVSPTEQPAHDPYTQNVTEVTPVYIPDRWTQAWEVSAATPEETEERVKERYDQTLADLAIYYDAQAQLGGFADRNACVARAGYAGEYQAYGVTFGLWMDECNTIAAALPQPFPPTENIIALFPPLAWPFTEIPFAP